jgi:hypothetical protein
LFQHFIEFLQNLFAVWKLISLKELSPLRIPVFGTSMQSIRQQTMLISREVNYVVSDVYPSLLELQSEFLWQRVMPFKVGQASLAPHSCNFLIEAVDILLSRNPGLTAEGWQLPIRRVQFSQSPVGAAVKPQ